jgi:hypothetical protein
MLGLFDFINIIHNKDKLIDFLIHHGVLANTIKCSQCGNDVNINKDTLTFRCNGRHYIKNEHKKRVCKRCEFYKSARTGTWFYKSNADITTICKIVACFLMFRHPRHDDTMDETGVASATIVDWFNFCREVIIYFNNSLLCSKKYLIINVKILILYYFSTYRSVCSGQRSIA